MSTIPQFLKKKKYGVTEPLEVPAYYIPQPLLGTPSCVSTVH